jgi:hypothetical protein
MIYIKQNIKLSFTLFLTILIVSKVGAQYDDCNFLIDTSGQEQLVESITDILLKEEKQIIALGENHLYHEENSIVTLSMLKAMSKKYKDIKYIMEIPYSASYFINQYLKENDTTFFKVMRSYSCIHIKHIKKLKEISSSQKLNLEVIGLDISGKSFLDFDLFALNKLFSQKDNLDKGLLSNDFLELEILTNLPLDEMLKKTTAQKMELLCSNIYNKFNDKNNYIKESNFFNKNWKDIKDIIVNHKLGNDYRNSNDNYGMNKREDILYQRFKTLKEKNSDSKFYIHFGSSHISKQKKSLNIEEPFVSRLHQDSMSLLSIISIYNYKPNNYRYYKWKKQKKTLKLLFFGESSIIDRIHKLFHVEKNHIINTKGTITVKKYDYILMLNKTLAYTD